MIEDRWRGAIENLPLFAGGIPLVFDGVEANPIFSWAWAHELADFDTPHPTPIWLPRWPSLAEGFLALAVRVGSVASADLREDKAHDFKGRLARGVGVLVDRLYFLLVM